MSEPVDSPANQTDLRRQLEREARRLTRDPDEAQDLVQECLVILTTRGGAIREGGRPLAWRRAGMRNLWRRRLRRRWYGEVLGIENLPEPPLEPWDAVDTRLDVEAAPEAGERPWPARPR